LCVHARSFSSDVSLPRARYSDLQGYYSSQPPETHIRSAATYGPPWTPTHTHTHTNTYLYVVITT